MSKHPGGFDRAFFERTLPAMGAAFSEARGGDMMVVVYTAAGVEIPVVRARVSLTWAELQTEAGTVEYVPFREIARVSIGPRPPAEETRHPIGFSAEPLPEDAHPSPPPAPPATARTSLASAPGKPGE